LSAEQLLRDREERHQQARFARAEPEAPQAPRTVEARPVRQPDPPASPTKAERWTPKPVVSRRNALELIGLLGLQGAAAAGTIKVMDQRSTDAANIAAAGGAPPGVLAAGGGNVVDGSDDPLANTIDQPALAAFNNGASLYSPLPGPAP